MKSILKSILALAMLTLFPNINWAMGQTVNVNRWIELHSESVGRTMLLKFVADSPNTGVRLVCGAQDTTITVGTNWTDFLFYVPNDTVKIYGNVKEFDCRNQLLSGINISNNTGLVTLDCQYNSLSTLDLSWLTALEEVRCNNNSLTFLNLGGCTNLQELDCRENNLTSLGLSSCTALRNLNCKQNNLFSLDLSGCMALEDLNCEINHLSSLDLSNYTALRSLYCWNNNLTSLDLNNCTSLEELECPVNNISSLNLTGCTALTYFFCDENKLTSLDLSGFTALETLGCFYNDLTSLILTNCVSLRTLYCSYNNLSSLDLRGCTKLKTLWCYTNNISDIKIGVSKPYMIKCNDNNLSACGLDSLFHQLPINTSSGTYTIYVHGNPGTYSCRDTIATNRNWNVSGGSSPIVNTEYGCPYFTLGVEEMNNTINAKIYPNPVTNNLYIECENDIKSIEIYDALGRKIISKEDHSDKTSIDFSNLGNGVYILKLRVAEGTGEFKVIKQ